MKSVPVAAVTPRTAMVPYVGDRRVLAMVYGSLFVPLVGPLLLAVVSSIVFYRVQRERPGFAAWLNVHAFIAILINVACHLAIMLWVRR